MAKKIGDAGMVLPDAPKLMFENALALGGAMSDHMRQLLTSSLGVEIGDEYAAFDSSTLSEEQKRLLDEWQGVATKSRLLPKLDLHGLVEHHYPIPLLATIKAVRDGIPPKPIEAHPSVIEHYPVLLEAVAEWESTRLTAAADFVKAFAAEDGSMSESRYRAMHAALMVAFHLHNRYDIVGSEMALDDFLNPTNSRAGMNADVRRRLLHDVSVEDVQAANRCIGAFTDKDQAGALLTAISQHREFLANGRYSFAEYRRISRQSRKLGEVSDQAVISRYVTSQFEKTLMHRQVNSKRTKYVHEGVFPTLVSTLVKNPDADIPVIDRVELASGALGIKISDGAPKTAEEAIKVELPSGTPVDEEGNALKQPRRPERLDLSAQVAAVEADDLEDTQEAAFEDFRFLIDQYGFRGLQIGNYVPQKMRRYLTGAIHQAVEDMAHVAKIPPQMVSLGNPLPGEVQEDDGLVDHQHYDGRSLGLALGARGRGKAAAHYEPGKHIINMTRDKGAGSLAHEWGHALDYTLSDLCDFRRVKQLYNDATIARVTGRSRGAGVETISEAFAVFWTLHTNHHIERQQKPPQNSDIKKFAGNLLKPQHDTPENVAMLTGIGHAMKAIYAEDVPDEQLSRDHGARLADKINLTIGELNSLMIELSQLHQGTLNRDDARGKLWADNLWSFDAGENEAGIRGIAKLDRFTVELWASDRVAQSASQILNPTRVPHERTLQAIQTPVRHAVSAAIYGAKLQVMAMDHGRVWSSDSAETALRQYRDELEAEDKWQDSRTWMAFQLGEFLRHTPAEHREQVEMLLEQLDTHVDLLAMSIESMDRELDSPTPHDMEQAMSRRPASIERDQEIAGPGKSTFKLLHSVHGLGRWAAKAHDLAKGARAMFTIRYGTEPDLRSSRLEIHPRMLSRIQGSLAARFDNLLAQLFSDERQIIDAMGIEDPEAERPHPNVPSQKARAAIHEPAMLKAVLDLIVEERDSRFRSGTGEDLAGRLGFSDVMSGRLSECLQGSTPSLRYSMLIDTLASTRDTISTARRRRDETEDEYNTRHSDTDRLMAQMSCIAEQYSYNKAEEVVWLRTALYSGQQEAFERARSQSTSSRWVDGRALRDQDSRVNMILDKLADRCVTRPRTMATEEPEDATSSQEAYQALLRNLAVAADEYGPRFAYMTPDERSTLLSEALGADIDCSREALQAAFMEGASPMLDSNSVLQQRIHPPVASWADMAMKSLSTALHLKDMSKGERDTLSAMKGDYRQDVAEGIPLIRTSRMARASAAYEKRDLAMNGYLKGSAPKYWCTPSEMFARAFETYTYDALEAEGRESPYLVTVAGRSRQEMVAWQAESLVAKDVLRYNVSDLVYHEKMLFKDKPADYSFTYPSGSMRDALPKSFQPLVASLGKGLSQRFPEATALAELHREQQSEKTGAELPTPIETPEDATHEPREEAPSAEDEPLEVGADMATGAERPAVDATDASRDAVSRDAAMDARPEPATEIPSQAAALASVDSEEEPVVPPALEALGGESSGGVDGQARGDEQDSTAPGANHGESEAVNKKNRPATYSFDF